ncbi:MAG: ComEA family DNA-binding protein [Syntrophales bacterium]|nr:ComEA family DNA-binding protein [Syntrophales bacterium]
MKHSRSILLVFAIVFCIALCAPIVSANEAVTKVNINKATAEELTVLKYVGTALSQRIVDYREANGAFKTAGDIVNVPGIAQRVYEGNKDIIAVD